jgi:dipeptidyl aminopeptidase/acylaminoacyl peptidase
MTSPAGPGAVQSPEVPVELLLGNPERKAPALSPAGDKLAFLAPRDGVMNIWVQPLQGGEARAVTSVKERDLAHVDWSGDGDYLLHLRDTDGDEDFHLWAVPADGGAPRDLTPFPGCRAEMVRVDPDHPDVCWIALNKDDPTRHDLYSLRLSDASLELVERGEGIVRWFIDPGTGTVGGITADADGSADVGVYVDGAWRSVHRLDPDDAPAALYGPLVDIEGGGGAVLVVSPQDAETARLLRIDVATGAVEVLVEDEVNDVTSVVLDGARRPVLACVEAARREWRVLDESYAEVLLAAASPDCDPVPVSHDAAGRMWVVEQIRADSTNTFVLVDRADGSVREMFDDRPALREHRLASMAPIELTSRDGLPLHGYLMLPPGREAKSLPLVLWVHGGPWVREHWEFHEYAQYYATRGYAVLTVNFRGSTGYGKAFLNAGDREWGGRMHDDLLDAVAHVVDLGVADPQRVAIVGGSYGGYASLWAAVASPDVFRCAIAVVAPSNLITLMETIPPYWGPMRGRFLRALGDPETEREFLWSRSPLSRVDELRIPLLLIHGAHDPRVKQSEADQVAAALDDRGVPYEYIVVPDEGHGFVRPENNVAMLERSSAFLGEHL